MEETITLPVGDDSSAPFLAFGDDSQFGDRLAFAFVVLRRERLHRVERRINDLKDRFRIPRDMALHCRILFNELARRKAGLAHLSREDAYSIVARVVRIMNREEVLLRYAEARLSRFKEALGTRIELTHVDGSGTTTFPVVADPKALLGILANGCFYHEVGPMAAQCEIFVSEDSTRIGLIGPGRRRADSMYSGFSAIGAPDGSVFQLRPKVVTAESVPALQLADISAYMCSHADDALTQRDFFRDQLQTVRYWQRSRFTADEPPAPGDA